MLWVAMDHPRNEPIAISEPIGPLTEWTPKSVKAAIQRIEKTDLSASQRAILQRLALDPRMKQVWIVFLKRNRQTGEYAHPALKERRPEIRSKEKLQKEALGEILHFAFKAACDQIPVTKLRDVLQNKELLVKNVSMLRALAHDLDLARKTGQLGLKDALSKELATQDVASLLHVANWLERLVDGLRKADDPLMVRRHRGNPIVRGAQTLIAEQLVEMFGKRLMRTATTLASVALNANASASSARSASPKNNVEKRKPRTASKTL